MEYFGHRHITRSALVSLMDFLSKIQIEKYGSVNNSYVQRKLIKVPVQFASREKWFEIYNSNSSRKAMNPAINDANPVEFQWILPRIGVQLNAMQYDPQRKLIKTQKIPVDSSSTSSSSVYSPAPFNLDIDVYIVSKTLDDQLQIMEQIVPFFSPELSLDIRIIEDQEPESVPISLVGVTYDIPSDLTETEERLITFIYTFTMKLNYYNQKTRYGFNESDSISITIDSVPGSGDYFFNTNDRTISKESSVFGTIPGSGSYIYGIGYPSKDIESEYYLDTLSGKWYKKINGVWYLIGSYTNSTEGKCDYNWIVQSGIPSNSLGTENNTYLDLSTYTVYRKLNGIWNEIFTLYNVLNFNQGITSPAASSGNVGDYYLNKCNLYIKTSEGWLLVYTSGIVINSKPLILWTKSNVYTLNDYVEVDQKWIQSLNKIETKFNSYTFSATKPNPFV